MDGKTLAEIRNFVLQNAVKYGGKADPKAIVGKIMGQHASLRADPKGAMETIRGIVDSVNGLSLDEQRAELTKSAPELLEKKEAKRREIFDVLGISEGDKVRTAFPPGPEKYPHIGHAKASLFNYLIAKRYGGEFVLRFEDTNPNLVKKEFYDIIQENLKWLGVEWDELVYASDHMQFFYEMAEKLIRSGDAYMCTCDTEAIRDSRMKGCGCDCRERGREENMKLWKGFPDMDEGKAVLRLKIELDHKNTTMRDPTMFRIIRTPHARHGDVYSVWPTYDFQNACMDGKSGITHRVRSKEFEMRSELQRYIQDLLGLPRTMTYEFARFNIVGVESSGRMIREKVMSGEFMGWDDPQLTTIVALRRRGFLPEAIKEFLLKTGMTKAEATLTWDDLIMHNKRILDSTADRKFMVVDPVTIHIKGAPEMMVRLKRHPEHPERGYREFSLGQDLYLQKSDVMSMEDGKLYRLMDAFNFRVDEGEYSFVSEGIDDYRREGKGIFHYLPLEAELEEVSVMMPDHSIIRGKSEPISSLSEGDIIQYERFGFVRLDSKGENRFWFTHR